MRAINALCGAARSRAAQHFWEPLKETGLEEDCMPIAFLVPTHEGVHLQHGWLLAATLLVRGRDTAAEAQTLTPTILHCKAQLNPVTTIALLDILLVDI